MAEGLEAEVLVAKIAARGVQLGEVVDDSVFMAVLDGTGPTAGVKQGTVT